MVLFSETNNDYSPNKFVHSSEWSWKRELTKHMLSLFLNWQMVITVKALRVLGLWENIPLWFMQLQIPFLIVFRSITTVLTYARNTFLEKNKKLKEN